MKKVALLFPGQGSQMAGMGKWFYDHYPIAKRTFEEADDTLGWSVTNACFHGPIDQLTSTDVAQPALLTASMAMYRVYREEIGVHPFAAAGHSLGEYSALCGAGAISFAEALELVHFRGQTMKAASELGTGTMLAVGGIDYLTAEEQLATLTASREEACIACYNGPFQAVVSGTYPAMERVESHFRKLGAKVTHLQVGAPFHHPLMQSAAEELKRRLEQVAFKTLHYKVLSNVTGHAIDANKQSLVEELTRQMTLPVQWHKSMNVLHYWGIELAIELGPKTVLKQLLKSHEAIDAFAYDVAEDRKRLASRIANRTGEASRSDHPIAKLVAIAVTEPNRRPDDPKARQGVVEPYKRLIDLRGRLEQQNKQPGPEDIHQGLQWLQAILQMKGVPPEQQRNRLAEANLI
ncbi:[acyl-carrier-protein] S-malonyltransferase [Cohnella sp. CIP 111063]|uniref:ACP S-malonyltransferase n=1 Tax=unclassified Cohnella TaxID=2636738 RepID=UPI000B8C51BD|nr:MULTISPECIES: ACP S-malonyltransferase [unclassified Cohnella]OXS61053.1 [acyl-carrier-protein] S-malonyltransferase [Cohnella sp. CIP 111063]PRX73598.1 [acyl-carrier-protein] S-malonyltransferase [Cohnella sp. SGD-V74]